MGIFQQIFWIICGFLATKLLDNLTDSPLRKLSKFFQGILCALLLVVIATDNQSSKNMETASQKTVQQATQIDSETNSTSASLNSTTETDYSSTEEAITTGQNVSSGISLLDLKFVDDHTDKAKYLQVDSIQANGETFKQALYASGICESDTWITCESQHGDSAVQSREYVLGGKYSRLSAKLVVLDSSSGTHTVRISAKNGLNEFYTIEPGDTRDITVDVSGVSRLKIEFTNLSVADGIAEGEEFVNTGIALADPILTK